MSLSDQDQRDVREALAACRDGRSATAIVLLSVVLDRAKACDICGGVGVVRRQCADTFRCCRLPTDGHARACPGCDSRATASAERCRDRVPYATFLGMGRIREEWLVCDRAEGHTGNHEATMPEGTRRQW